jgi:hypothetical protein
MSHTEAIIAYFKVCCRIFLEGLREFIISRSICLRIFNTYLPRGCELLLYCYTNEHVNLLLSVYVKKL